MCFEDSSLNMQDSHCECITLQGIWYEYTLYENQALFNWIWAIL